MVVAILVNWPFFFSFLATGPLVLFASSLPVFTLCNPPTVSDSDSN